MSQNRGHSLSTEAWGVVVAAGLTIVLSVIGFFLVRTLNQIDTSMTSMTDSVNKLNSQMGTVLTEMSYQRRDIDSTQKEVEKLKEQIFNYRK